MDNKLPVSGEDNIQIKMSSKQLDIHVLSLGKRSGNKIWELLTYK